LKKQNKKSFIKYLSIGLPVFLALGVVAFLLTELGIDRQISATQFAALILAIYLTDKLVARFYKKDK